MILEVRKGDTWAGGLNKPFVASWEAIGAALKEMGLVLVDHFERDERPLPFDPRAINPYDDDWDNVALVRVERGQTVELPDRVKWTRLMDRVAQRTSASPLELVGFESGLAASIAADEANRRGRDKQAKSKFGTVAEIALWGGGLIVPGLVILARRARRRRY
jgi:hypothetical protein